MPFCLGIVGFGFLLVFLFQSATEEVDSSNSPLSVQAAAAEDVSTAGAIKLKPKSSVASKRALGAAPTPLPFPQECYSEREFDPLLDEQCFNVVKNLTRQEMAADPTRPLCWGYDDLDAREGLDPERPRMLYHTIALTGMPSSIVLPLWSFLATQCCDAVLWFWVGHNVSIPAENFGIPPYLAQRIVYKRLDLDAMFESVRADFPPVPKNVTDALQGFTDIRYVADWARLLIMYVHGGLYFDIDTVLLRDLRPLYGMHPESMLTYREAPGPYMNNAFLRLPQRPAVSGWEVVADVLATGKPLPERVCDAIVRRPGGYSNLSNRKKMTRLSMSTVDFIWFKFLAKGNRAFWSDGMRDIHPEMRLEQHWDDFFTPLPPDMAARVRNGREWFMEGSYAYHCE